LIKTSVYLLNLNTPSNDFMPEPSESSETKTTLLDAAEMVFADQGISGASVRAITQKAGANLAAVHYHFGSKQNLVRAVFSRRLGPLNRERLELLDACDTASGEPHSLRSIVRAFVSPVLQLMGSNRTGGLEFARLVSRTLFNPTDELKAILLEEFSTVIDRFTDALATALPHLSKAETYWRFHFMAGAMAHTVASGNLLEKYSQEICSFSDLECVTDQLVDFVVGGLLAPSVQSK
jgi:AcrR family transcriptional regulator